MRHLTEYVTEAGIEPFARHLTDAVWSSSMIGLEEWEMFSKFFTDEELNNCVALCDWFILNG